MKHTYIIDGMTCSGCVASVTEKLGQIQGVDLVEVNLVLKEAYITTSKHISIDAFKVVLPEKFSIKVKEQTHESEKEIKQEEKSKLQQLKPLLLIFAYIFSAVFLLNFKEWNITKAMLDFMGLFYIVFSFFKLLDLKGFPESFRMYDPFAKLFPFYGKVYPFIELVLGVLFLMRIWVFGAIALTIVILGVTTIGVAKTLLDKKRIRCACLGTALKLPMTEATFIENAIMLVMAITMLIQMIYS